MPLIIFTGPSASGKSTIVSHLLRRRPDKIIPIISSTTRLKREHEPVPYNFIEKSDFELGIQTNKFFEYEKYGDNYYGISFTELAKIKNKEKAFGIVDVDRKGFEKFLDYKKNNFARSIENFKVEECANKLDIIFVYVFSTRDIVESRLSLRKPSKEDLEYRLRAYDEDIKLLRRRKNEIDIVIKNDNKDITHIIDKLVKKLDL